MLLEQEKYLKSARDILVEKTLEILPHIASKKAKNDKYLYEDLIQEGSFAIMNAAETYNYKGKKSFKAYVLPWVYIRMDRYLQKIEKAKEVIKAIKFVRFQNS